MSAHALNIGMGYATKKGRKTEEDKLICKDISKFEYHSFLWTNPELHL